MADTGKYGRYSSGRNSEKEKPAGNGFHFQGESKNAVLIFCVDYAQEADVRDMLAESGIDGMVPRPFFLSNLALAIARTKTNAVSEMENESILNGMHFLCAEDNELNAEILKEILEMYGASCTIYPDGEAIVQAFKQVKPGEYDVILMDVQHCIGAGMDAHIAKPLDIAVLEKTLRVFAGGGQIARRSK